jgi:sterol desaturase/sphingolipid hydroxylase (fatty acid hydroxylase superfamily)
MHTVVQKVLKQLLEPFSSWERFKDATTIIVWNVTNLDSKTAWPWLLTSLVVAYLVYLYGRKRGHFDPSKSFRQFAFPKEVYLHRSAIMDYKFVLFDQLFGGLLFLPFISGVTYFVYLALSQLLGTSSFHVSRTVALWLVPVYAVLVVDLGYYIGHRLLHVVPFLWPFHEVHHSAEVLSPVTVFRVHPVEDMFNVTVHAVFNALSAAVFTSITDIKVDPYQLLGLNAVPFLYHAVGFQLRHSHIWLSYGPVLDRIFSSPAQHQVHHSEAQRHWNKNFGLIFSFWDVMFGTMYLPREREEIRFGSGSGTDPSDFGTVSKLYLLPFRKSYQAMVEMVRPSLPLAPNRSDLPGAAQPSGSLGASRPTPD